MSNDTLSTPATPATPVEVPKKEPQWRELVTQEQLDGIKRLSVVSTGSFLLTEVVCTDTGIKLPVRSWSIAASTDNVVDSRKNPEAAFPKITVEVVMAVLMSDDDDDNPEEMPELRTTVITRPMHHVLFSTMNSCFKFKKSYDPVFNYLWSKLNSWPNFYMSPSQVREVMAVSAQLDKVLPSEAVNPELAAAADEEGDDNG